MQYRVFDQIYVNIHDITDINSVIRNRKIVDVSHKLSFFVALVFWVFFILSTDCKVF